MQMRVVVALVLLLLVGCAPQGPPPKIEKIEGANNFHLEILVFKASQNNTDLDAVEIEANNWLNQHREEYERLPDSKWLRLHEEEQVCMVVRKKKQ
jgi:hypothetical protein